LNANHQNNGTRPAPTTAKGVAKELGPGLIVAGAVVGSGELIATTATGSEAGFWLMWLIIIGCLIKVFVQVELGRYVILTGKTTLQGITGLPGWKPRGTHWIAWFWLLMIIAATGQMGGIIGGVGQALSIAVPITEEGKAFNDITGQRIKAQLAKVDLLANDGTAVSEIALTAVGSEPTKSLPSPGIDPYAWALLISVITAVILYFGRYGMIETVVTVLVAGFTLLTLLNLVLLQMNPTWAVTWADLRQGLSFGLPPKREGLDPIVTALATFGIIGVAAGELVFYPYWCLEKGYASFIGPREDTDAWNQRARGWIRVLRWDAWCSMVVYTTSTVIFYLLGAAVLGRSNLHPQGMDMIRTLAAMYEPVFNETAVGLFLVAAAVILYSTFFVTNASKARVFADAMVIFGWRKSSPEANRKWIKGLCIFFPLISFVIFCFIPKPKELILLAGTMQSFMLPMLGFAAIYFRYKHTIPALKPTRTWDIFLWISALGLLIAGAWLAISKLAPLF
jgi:Mn2+/Fe2+ NRAMP family transporter|tara:strand:+ start:1294 stop:2817 length:1524 start_codon:yes stop_codon:yes gene_type:complete